MSNIRIINNNNAFLIHKYQKNKKNHMEVKAKNEAVVANPYVCSLRNYYLPLIYSVDEKNIDKDKLQALGIPNFRYIGNNNVRGESLSSKKNRKFLIPVKKSGIKNIIDLRDKYSSQSYVGMCAKLGLNYFQIPIDSDSVSDKEIIKNMPTLFKTLNEGKTYIACAQGLHRTDIALALNYIFNPKEQKNPPVMYGHFRNFGFKFDDISRRINSIKRQITDEDLCKIGWNSLQEFEKTFSERKKQLKDYNTELGEKYKIHNGQ